MKNFLRDTIKKFALYQIYKFSTPRRIAGETRKQKFIDNMLIGGLKLASRHAGGSKKELANYSPEFIKKLEKQHQKMSRGSIIRGIIL
jgi:hypothetical protein